MALNSATTTLATIQMRRGAEENFDPDQMTAGEWAVSTDTKYVRMCFMPGLCLRMATYEAFEKDMEEIRAILVEAQDIQLAIQTWFKLAESYAHGGTGAREGEETDNAKYYAEQAKISADNAAAVADIGIMTTEKAGIGKPDGTTITVDEDGTMHSVGGGGGSEGNFASKAIYGDDAISLGRVSDSVVGEKSIAFGRELKATNLESIAFGESNESSGKGSFVSGYKNTANGHNSFSTGNNNYSVDDYSFSEGCGNIALGYGSHVEGAQNISGAKYVLKIASYDTSAKTFTFDDTYTGFSESFAQLAAGVRLHIANVNYINEAYVYTVTSVGSDGKSVFVNENIPTSNFSVYLATIIKSGGNYGDCHSEGRKNISLNTGAHSEGYMTKARGVYSHSEGSQTEATANQSHSEGFKTKATGDQSHSEGYGSTASGKGSHAGGTSSTASGEDSFTHGYKATSTAKGSFSCGINTTASEEGSFCCGAGSSASGIHSHAEGGYTSANGWQSHAEGRQTTANGDFSHSEGFHTTSLYAQHAQGHYNDTSKAIAGTTEGTLNGTAFVIGNGTPTTPSNAARIDYNGKLWCKQAYSSTGADYAELFEWADGNPENEDRRGFFVTVDGKKIRKAQSGDYILGIISGNPSVIGNTDMEWYGQFMRDEFGTFIKENYKGTIKEPVVDEEGNVTEEEKEVDVEFYKVNPDYDPDAPYTFRLDRPEWDAVGMLGVLPVRDDGTCEVGKFCKCADGGIATLATERGFDTYMVIERATENIVSVILK